LSSENLCFERLAATDQESFDDLYRKPRAMIAAMANRPDYDFLLARQER
jgi:hypothetical protein